MFRLDLEVTILSYCLNADIILLDPIIPYFMSQIFNALSSLKEMHFVPFYLRALRLMTNHRQTSAEFLKHFEEFMKWIKLVGKQFHQLTHSALARIDQNQEAT